MDDLRIEWLRNKVYEGLNVSDPQVFEDMLARDDGENEMVIARYLNDTSDDLHRALLFYKMVREEEEEVEIECGKQLSLCFSALHSVVIYSI